LITKESILFLFFKGEDKHMKKTVILAEKPSQAKAYADAFQNTKMKDGYIEVIDNRFFNDKAFITWGIGHLVELKEPHEYNSDWKKWSLDHLPMIPERFEYRVKQSVSKQFNVVKKLFVEADILINACDIDREGSNIFYSIYYMTGAKNKTIKRLWINSLEVDEIRKGFSNLKDNKKDLLMYNEARTRQISDWLVGMNASRLYTMLLRNKGLNTVLSVGRCQSPLVYMIYQRQKEIENFVSKPFFELIGQFKAQNGTYEGKANIKKDTIEELTEFLKEKLLSLESEIEGSIHKVEKKEKRIKSPKLHSLSTLQTVANKKWKYSPSKVLETMQSLYEKKMVTYPRTDCNFITENEFSYLVSKLDDYKKILNVEFEANTEPNKRYVDGSKVQEHYAIIPTKTIPDENAISSLSNEERNIYFEIVRNTLAMFHSDYRYVETRILTVVNGVEFETVGKIELDEGWKSLFSNEQVIEKESENSENNEIKALPSVSDGEKVLSILKRKKGHTRPPKPFTEGGLINLMKTAGKMVDDEADSEILKEVEGIGTEATRAGIIEAVKNSGYIEVKKNIVYVTKKGEILCEAIEGTLLSSPSMTAKWESYLRKIGESNGSTETFIANINKFIVDLIQKAPGKINSTKVENAVNDEKKSHNKGTCPCCKKGEMVDRKTFIGCSEYKNGCKFSINRSIAGKKLTEKNIKDLLEKGRTTKIKGFKSKSGKTFEAALVIKEGKVFFEFE